MMTQIIPVQIQIVVSIFYTLFSKEWAEDFGREKSGTPMPFLLSSIRIIWRLSSYV